MDAEIKADIDKMLVTAFQDRDYGAIRYALELKLRLLEIQLSYSPLPLNITNKN